MTDELPPGVTRLPRRSRDSSDTAPPFSDAPDYSRGKRSKNVYADAQGKCTHDASRPFCHSPKHQAPGGLCHLPPGWGTDHVGSGPCKQHGGALWRVTRHHQEVLAERRATAELERLNTTPARIDNPLAALAELAGEASRWKDILAAHVSELTSLRYAGENQDGSRTEQIRGEVILFQNALKDLGHLLVSIARLNIDDRLARIDERMVDVVERAVDAGLQEAGVTPDNMSAVRRRVGAALRRMSA